MLGFDLEFFFLFFPTPQMVNYKSKKKLFISINTRVLNTPISITVLDFPPNNPVFHLSPSNNNTLAVRWNWEKTSPVSEYPI